MLREFFFHGHLPTRFFAWCGLIVFFAHHVWHASLALQLNGWYKNFYDVLGGSANASSESVESLQSHQLAIRDKLSAFVRIVAPAVLINPAASYVRQRWLLSWRMSLMRAYLKRWRQIQKRCCGAQIVVIEGAAQRVHEDTQRFSAGIQGAGSVVLGCAFTLATFLPILGNLDSSLLAIAFGVAVAGVMVSIIVGWPLVDLEVQNQRAEAAVRTRLEMQWSTGATGAAGATAADAETLEEPTRVGSTRRQVNAPFPTLPVVSRAKKVPTSMNEVLLQLECNYKRLFRWFAKLNVWLSSYDQFGVILPYLVAAPRIFAIVSEDRLTLGELTQITNAFGKVFQSLSTISDSWLEINEFRSTLRRLRQFERMLSAAPPRSTFYPLDPPDEVNEDDRRDAEAMAEMNVNL